MKKWLLLLCPVLFFSCEQEQPATNSEISVTTSSVTDITSVAARSGGTIESQQPLNNATRGVCWSTSPNPTIGSNNTSTAGVGRGTFAATITNLTPSTQYYVRAFLYTTTDTLYGNEVSFQTIPTPPLPYVITQSVSGTTDSSTTSGGIVLDEGSAPVTRRGICYSTQANPTLSNDTLVNGSGLGAFLITLKHLSRNTTYHVRAFAINNNGVSYGTNVTFTTQGTLPILSTNDLSSITQTTAVGGGNITDNGGSDIAERGLCWGTSPSPEVSGNHIAQGGGMGSFTTNLSGLSSNTTYYVRAYARNATGVGYGENKIFTTLPELPTVVTGDVSQITYNSATGSGTVVSAGGANVTHRGVCWSTQNPPSIDSTSNNYTDNGIGTGFFTSQITGLNAGTPYYVRAYAMNAAGIAYGNTITFTSAPPPPVRFDYLPGNNINEFGSTSFVYWNGSQNLTLPWTINTNGYSGTALFATNPATSRDALGGYVTFTKTFPGNGFVRFWINTRNPGYDNRIPTIYVDGVAQSAPVSIGGQASSFYWQQFQTADISAGTHTIKIEWSNSGMYYKYALDEVECYRY